ncbi:MAG: ComF family protein, partial [Bacteroidaceae bacterium]|nr:ComF family protein [Bacteroidaceae bacterium]
YNQSALLAKGISEVVGIPVVNDAIYRVVDNPTQTHLTDTERWENVQGIFQVSSEVIGRLHGKHLMLVDDVTTTGATLASCAEVLYKAVPQCRISVIVLGVADLG